MLHRLKLVYVCSHPLELVYFCSRGSTFHDYFFWSWRVSYQLSRSCKKKGGILQIIGILRLVRYKFLVFREQGVGSREQVRGKRLTGWQTALKALRGDRVLTGVGFLHLGRESGIGNRESGIGNRNPPLTPPRRGKAGNGENYPGN